MKLSDLKLIVEDLNEGEQPDTDTAIVSSTNLALNHLNRVIPMTKSIVIEQDEPILAVLGEVNTETEYEAEDVAGISFEARGAGNVVINGVTVKSWAGYTTYTPIRITPGESDVTVVLTGDIYNLGFFGNVHGAIPVLGTMISYDMNTLADDYISFYSPPSRDGGEPVPGYIFRTPNLLIPVTERGRVTVDYKRKPTRVTLDSVVNDDDIDIDAECEDLLALLVAHYITMGTDERKSKKYLDLFMTQAALALTQRTKDTNNNVYTNGW